MKLYEVYEHTTCPVCGNREANRDHGPYEPHPLDEELGGTPPDCVHLMTCGRCSKCFDVAPDWYVTQQTGHVPVAPFSAACAGCFPDAEHPALPLATPAVDDGLLRASYRCAECGREWSCWWKIGQGEGWPVRREESAA